MKNEKLMKNLFFVHWIFERVVTICEKRCNRFPESSICYIMMIIVFVVLLTDERRLALFPAGTIVRDPHHHGSPTRCEQGLNLRRT